jgi:hypothetical protein
MLCRPMARTATERRVFPSRRVCFQYSQPECELIFRYYLHRLKTPLK